MKRAAVLCLSLMLACVGVMGAILPGGLSQHQAFIFGAILIAVTFAGMVIYTVLYKDPEEQKA